MMGYDCDIENEEHDGNTIINECRICAKSLCEVCGYIDFKIHRFHVSPEELEAIKEGTLLIEDLILSKKDKI